MKNMRKFVKQNIKGFIVGLIVTGIGIVTASTIMPSNSVTYNNNSQNVTNVKEALDVLLEKADNEAPTVSVSVSGKTATFTLKDDLGVIGYQVTTSATAPTSWIDITSTTSIVKTWTASSAGTYYVHVKDKFGKTSNASFTIATSSFCAYSVGQTWTFNYTGGVQSLPITCSGTYKLEVWGGQGQNGGGDKVISAVGGKGGYSYGNKTLTINDTLYIVVGGGSGNNYNGGGTGGGVGNGGVGGGATHIATTNRGVLANYNSYRTEVLIVAGGGGGAGSWSVSSDTIFDGGTGGGATGGTGSCNHNWNVGTGGTQTAGGTGNMGSSTQSGYFGSNGQFGVGGSLVRYSGAGGGGGWYGGGSGSYYNGGTPGGGGSGYIGGVTGGSMTNGQRSGNGMARITLVSLS